MALPNRFIGLVKVDATTAKMDSSTIVNEVIQHVEAKRGIDMTASIEIEARTRDGFETDLQRTIEENCGVLQVRSANFEQEYPAVTVAEVRRTDVGELLLSALSGNPVFGGSCPGVPLRPKVTCA